MMEAVTLSFLIGLIIGVFVGIGIGSTFVWMKVNKIMEPLGKMLGVK